MNEWFNAGRISPVPSGTWNEAAAYSRLDIVTDPNMQRSYIAKKDVPAGTLLTDTDYWQLLVDAFHAVSLKTAADRLASPFSETSNAVACHPVEDYPLGVVTHIEPVQSGSGDPSPDNIRPITGHTGDVLTRCGKNLLNPDNNDSMEGLALPGNCVGKTLYFSVYSESGTSQFNGCVNFADGTRKNFAIMNVDAANGTWYTYSYTIPKDAISCGVYNVTASTKRVGIKAMISFEGTEYEPYHADTFTADFGKNLANLTYGSTVPSISTGQNVSTISGWSSDYIAIDGNQNMVLSVSKTSEARVIYLFAYDIDKNYIGYTSCLTADSNSVFLSNISGYKNARYCRIRLDGTASIAHETQLEYGSMPTSFVPYNADLIAKTGGMVYGGTLDWNTGVLTVDRALKTITGEEVVTWQNNSGWNAGSWYCGTILPGVEELAGFGTVANMVCSHAPVKTPGIVAVTVGCIGYGNGTNLYVNFGAQYNTVSLLNEFFAAQNAAGTPVQIAYKLNTPITIQLTQQEILALGGVNTLYAEAGDVTVDGRISPVWMNEQLKSAIIALGGSV